jgi:hypothetical protein
MVATSFLQCELGHKHLAPELTPAHRPAPVPTTQIPSFNSPVAEQGSFVDVSSEDNSPQQPQDREISYENYVMEGGLLRPKRGAFVDLLSEDASPSLLSLTRLLSEDSSPSAPRPAQLSLIASPSESNRKSDMTRFRV